MNVQYRTGSVDEKCRINCPNHGMQATYTLFTETEEGKKVGVGCARHYGHLPILNHAAQQAFYAD